MDDDTLIQKFNDILEGISRIDKTIQQHEQSNKDEFGFLKLQCGTIETITQDLSLKYSSLPTLMQNREHLCSNRDKIVQLEKKYEDTIENICTKLSKDDSFINLIDDTIKRKVNFYSPLVGAVDETMFH